MINYLITWSDSAMGQVHLVLALIALITGPPIFMLKKGTGWHRALGYVYIGAMLSVNVSALLVYEFTGGFNFFHAVAIASLATLLPAIGFLVAGIRTQKTAYLGIHGALMGWSYFGLVMAAIAEVVTRGFPYMLHGEGGWGRFLTALFSFMLVTGVLTFWFMKRQLPKTLPSGSGK